MNDPRDLPPAPSPPEAAETGPVSAVSAASEHGVEARATSTGTRPAGRPQMADIARLAGVSVATVSRALNGHPAISAGTRLRIEALARELNYAVNVGAQNLRLKQNRTVAVVVPFEGSASRALSDPFALALIGGIADALSEALREMLLTPLDLRDIEQAAQLVESGRAAGVVLAGLGHDHEPLNRLAERGLPFVAWGGQLPTQLYTTVGTDQGRGGLLLTEHLLALGRRRVLFLGDTASPDLRLRHDGYRQAHWQRGWMPDPRLHRPVALVPGAVEEVMRDVLAEALDFDAVLAGNDMAALAVLRVLRRGGLRVPDDVAVAGYDDIPVAAYAHPALTTVAQPVAEAGRALVSLLLAKLAGDQPRSVVLPTRVEARASTLGIDADSSTASGALDAAATLGR